MKKPMYTTKLYALIFLCLGGAFLIMGLLCFVGIAKPSTHSSVQDPMIMGSVFSLLGAAFLILHIVLWGINAAQEKRHYALLAMGTRLNGRVEKVYRQTYTHYGKKSPFRLHYTYTYQGKLYRHKSYLFWDKPNLDQGDLIVVYANECGKSTILP